MSTDGAVRVSAADQRQRVAQAFLIAAGAAAGVAVALAVLLADNRIVIAVAVILAGLVVGLWRPFVAVLLYVAIAIIRPDELRLLPVFLHLERISAIFCVAALMLPQIARHTWQPWRWQRSDWSLIALLAAACWAVPASVSRPWALNGVYEVAKLGFLYAVVRYASTSVPRLRAIVWVMLLATAFAAVMSLHGLVEGRVYIGEHGVLRALGPTSTTGFGDPDVLGNSLVAMLPFALLLIAPQVGALPKLVHLSLIPLFLYAVALTGTRTAAVSMAAVVVVIIAQSRRRFLSLGLAAIAASLLWSVTPQDLRERYMTLRSYREEATYQGRVNNVRLACQMLRDRPATGCGVTCFRIARVEEYDGQWSDAHNLFGQVGSESGVPGLAAFTFFLVATFTSAWRARRTLRQLGAGAGPDYVWLARMSAAAIIMFIALLVQGLGSHNFLGWQFYVGSALIANSLMLARDELSARSGGPQPAASAS